MEWSDETIRLLVRGRLKTLDEGIPEGTAIEMLKLMRNDYEQCIAELEAENEKLKREYAALELGAIAMAEALR